MWWIWLMGCVPEEDDGGTPSDGPTCAELAPEGELELDFGGVGTQIHAASAADGTGVWVTWNQPDAAGLFDVFAAHVACDGVVDVGPVQVDDSEHNEIDPSVAVSGERVLVAWQSDNGLGGYDNLDVRWRILGLDGSPVGGVQEADTALNAWMPAVSAAPEGFVLAGSRAVDVFEGFWVALDPDGAAQGDLEGFGTDPGGGEFWPSVAAAEDGAVYLAWEGDAGVSTLEVGGTAEDLGAGGLAPSVSTASGDVWVGWGDGDDVLLARPGGEATVLKGGPKVQFGPAVAVGSDGGGHASWYTNVSGLDNEIQLGRFDAEGELLDSLTVSRGGAPPYGMNLTRIDDETVFVAWQEGDSPEFVLLGRFFRL